MENETEPTVEQDPPIEQLAQQQALAPIPLRHATEVAVATERGYRFHVFAVDENGSAWERWSDEAPGVWHEVEGPTR